MGCAGDCPVPPCPNRPVAVRHQGACHVPLPRPDRSAAVGHLGAASGAPTTSGGGVPLRGVRCAHELPPRAHAMRLDRTEGDDPRDGVRGPRVPHRRAHARRPYHERVMSRIMVVGTARPAPAGAASNAPTPGRDGAGYPAVQMSFGSPWTCPVDVHVAHHQNPGRHASDAHSGDDATHRGRGACHAPVRQTAGPQRIGEPIIHPPW
jgi:hypothetical protein